MDRSRDNLAVTSNGFKNWKDATISFKPHEASASHKEALQVVVVLRKVASGASKNFFYGLTNPKMLPPSLIDISVSIISGIHIVLLKSTEVDLTLCLSLLCKTLISQSDFESRS